MSALLPLQPNASVHLDDAVSGVSAHKSEPPVASAPTTMAPALTSSTVALSFAFDTVTKSLNVIMTDQGSGEVVRKISYTRLPSDVHQPSKLHGLLLDQFA